MDSKELVQLALNFESVPRVPYTIGFTVPARAKLEADPVGKALCARMDNDMLLSPTIRVEWGVRDKQGQYTDEFGQVWDRRIDADIGIPLPFVTPDNLNEIPWPDPNDPERFELPRINTRFSAWISAWTNEPGP